MLAAFETLETETKFYRQCLRSLKRQGRNQEQVALDLEGDAILVGMMVLRLLLV
jgi:hypothetical protein